MPLDANQISWEFIRINASKMGWPTIIARETIQHFTLIFRENDPSNYQSLHLFFEKEATAEERKQMLNAGYQPVC